MRLYAGVEEEGYISRGRILYDLGMDRCAAVGGREMRVVVL
jgi:hypothetical protein